MYIVCQNRFAHYFSPMGTSLHFASLQSMHSKRMQKVLVCRAISQTSIHAFQKNAKSSGVQDSFSLLLFKYIHMPWRTQYTADHLHLYSMPELLKYSDPLTAKLLLYRLRGDTPEPVDCILSSGMPLRLHPAAAAERKTIPPAT